MPDPTKILVCLEPAEWKKLDPYLSDVEYEKSGGPDEGERPMLEDRTFPDEVTYQKVLAIAKQHCPDLVREIEKARHYDG